MKGFVARFAFLAIWTIPVVVLFVQDEEKLSSAIGGYLVVSLIFATIWTVASKRRRGF